MKNSLTVRAVGDGITGLLIFPSFNVVVGEVLGLIVFEAAVPETDRTAKGFFFGSIDTLGFVPLVEVFRGIFDIFDMKNSSL